MLSAFFANVDRTVLLPKRQVKMSASQRSSTCVVGSEMLNNWPDGEEGNSLVIEPVSLDPLSITPAWGKKRTKQKLQKANMLLRGTQAAELENRKPD